MDNKDRRALSVRFSDEIVYLPPPDDGKKGWAQTRLTELERSDEEDCLLLQRPPPYQPRANRHQGLDEIAIFLALLCATPICFFIGIATWAFADPQDLCYQAPQLATFFNQLPAALLSVLPGLFVLVLLVLSPTFDDHFERGWTTLRMVLTMLLVALMTVLITPWARSVEGWSYQIDCSANWGP
ncbi:hypothetical protein PRZ48_012462 [Zasmidium cellare]|uniref:Uncharacterized protein n=1 Tax=Zasmidium cellare TaxID=395010 RepID=A0ABR0E4X8_ZASCE|nr:hypothetical protein PRZ48_012462 [Zasmidium cellare]